MSKKSKWSEIMSNYIEDADGGFHVLHVDAYTNNDHDDNGTVIAKLVGINKDGEPRIYTSYQDVDAMVDTYAKDVIQEAEQKLLVYLKNKA